MDKKLIFATVWPSFFFEAAIGHIGIPATYILEGLLLLFPQPLSILLNNEARTTLKPTLSLRLPKETYKRTFYTNHSPN